LFGRENLRDKGGRKDNEKNGKNEKEVKGKRKGRKRG